jgi:hypothetical protein
MPHGPRVHVNLVISRPRSRVSSALEFVLQRSRSWFRDLRGRSWSQWRDRICLASYWLRQSGLCMLIFLHNLILPNTNRLGLLLTAMLHRRMINQLPCKRSSCVLFKMDMRFRKLHKVIEKVMCVPATSEPVERIFSHGGALHASSQGSSRSKDFGRFAFFPNATSIWNLWNDIYYVALDLRDTELIIWFVLEIRVRTGPWNPWKCLNFDKRPWKALKMVLIRLDHQIAEQLQLIKTQWWSRGLFNSL